MKKALLFGVLIAGLLLAACSPAAAPTAEPTKAEVATQAEVATTAPTAEPVETQAPAEKPMVKAPPEGGRLGDEYKTGGDWDKVVTSCNDEANSPAIASIKANGSLRTAHGLFPPFAFQDPKQPDTLIGIDLDTVHDLADVMGVELNTVIVDWGVLAAGLQSDRYDMIASGFFALPERAEVVGFSKPYQMSGQYFYALKDRTDLNTIEDLNKDTITFIYGTGSAQKSLAEKYIPNAKVVDAPFRGQFILYEYLKTGRADVTATDSIYWPLIQKFYPDVKIVPENSEPIEPFPIAIAFKKDDAGMQVCVDAYVDWLLATNTFQERLAYWQEVSGSSGELE